MDVSGGQGGARPRPGLGIAVPIAVGMLATLGLARGASGAERSSGPIELSIEVVDPAGDPVRDAVVALAPLDPRSDEPAPPAPVPPTPGPDTAHAIMDQIDLAFEPHVLAIPTGTLVDFPNRDQVRHSIYSFSAPRVFEVKLYRGREAPPIYFDRPGLVVLGCNIHDDMLAYVYVLETPHAAVTGLEGAATIDDLPPGRYRVRVRHPRVEQSVLLELDHDASSSGPLRLSLPISPPPRAPTRRDDALDGLFGGLAP